VKPASRAIVERTFALCSSDFGRRERLAVVRVVAKTSTAT